MDQPIEPIVTEIPPKQKLKFSQPVQIAFVVLGVLLLSGLGVLAKVKLFNNTNTPTPTPTEEITPTPEITEEPTPEVTTTSSKPTTTPTKGPTPTPTRTPNPPKINITFPTENQTVELNSTQTFCLVEASAGGDHTDIQRRQNINDAGWTNYAALSTLCFNPKDGQNTIQLRYKNKYQEESEIYTRKFSFRQIPSINVTINGNLYNDLNCNGTKEAEEGNASISTVIQFYKMPGNSLDGQVTSNSDGVFTFTKTIYDTDTVSLQVTPIAPTGYILNPNFTKPTATLNKTNNSEQLLLPIVPNANAPACS